MGPNGASDAEEWEAVAQSTGDAIRDMTMTLFHSEGIWPYWYTLLWLEVIPFGVMLLWTLLRVSPERSRVESTWLNGAVLAAFFTQIVTSGIAVLLYARAMPDRHWYTYLFWIVVHFVVWTFLGSGVFFASLQALAAGPRIALRRVAAMLAVIGMSILHLATLYATWRFRIR